MLVSVGDLVTDVVIALATEVESPTADTPATVTQHRGGSAANVAAVTARLGRRARFVGPLGEDRQGRVLQSMLHDLGCDTAGPRIERAGTIAVIVSPDGARRFLTDRGTITPWGPPEPEWLDGARRVHFTAYALCDPLSSESCLALAKVATTRGIPISVDPSSVSMLAEFGVDRFGELLVELGADLLLPNREEAELLGVLTGAHPFAAVVTNGAAPTLARMLDGTDLHVEVAPTVAVDTTGAGDAFAAGFLAAFDEGASMTDSIRLGHDTAARVVGGMGAGAWDTPGHDESRHTTR